MLARVGPMIVRLMLSGLDGVLIVSPMVTTHDVPSADHADESRPLKLEPHRLPLARGHHPRAADGAAGIGVERRDIDIDGRVEHQPEPVGALEYGGRCLRGKRKPETEIVALARELYGDRTRLIGQRIFSRHVARRFRRGSCGSRAIRFGGRRSFRFRSGGASGGELGGPAP